VLRLLDGFGNIRPRAGDSWIDFLNMVKYPPSITFLLSTTGVNLILLGAFARAGQTARQLLTPLVIYGRAPLFFYVLHLFMYKGMGRWLTPDGTSIPAMYPFWLAVLIGLLPMCLFYREFKQRPAMNRVLRYL
jgi:predicted acyltransferase